MGGPRPAEGLPQPPPEEPTQWVYNGIVITRVLSSYNFTILGSAYSEGSLAAAQAKIDLLLTPYPPGWKTFEVTTRSTSIDVWGYGYVKSTVGPPSEAEMQQLIYGATGQYFYQLEFTSAGPIEVYEGFYWTTYSFRYRIEAATPPPIQWITFSWDRPAVNGAPNDGQIRYYINANFGRYPIAYEQIGFQSPSLTDPLKNTYTFRFY